MKFENFIEIKTLVEKCQWTKLTQKNNIKILSGSCTASDEDGSNCPPREDHHRYTEARAQSV
jgi:hypothetical protein